MSIVRYAVVLTALCVVHQTAWAQSAVAAQPATAPAASGPSPAGTSGIQSAPGKGSPAPKAQPRKPLDPAVINMLNQLNDWSRYYYLKPQPERTPGMVALMKQSGLLKEPQAQGWIVGLLSGIWAANPDLAAKSIGSLDQYVVDERRTLAQALWFANKPQTLAILKAQDQTKLSQLMGVDLLATQAPTMKLLPIRHTLSVDLLWGNFFATGDIENVRRFYPIIESYEKSRQAAMKAGATDTQKKEFAANAGLGPAIANPLIANAIMHDVVLKELEQQAKTGKGPLAMALAQIVQVAKDEKEKLKAQVDQASQNKASKKQ